MFQLTGKDFYAVTAGTPDRYNSMTGSGGGMGVMFREPVIWCIFRADRYTLELLMQEQKFTLSFFPDLYREQLVFLGTRSGRDTDKMRQVTLTPVATPSGNVAFAEARLVLECTLIEVTTPDPEDFYDPQLKRYVLDAFREADQPRRYVFGRIVHTWTRK